VPLPRVRQGRNTHASSDHGLQYQENGETIMGKAGQLLP